MAALQHAHLIKVSDDDLEALAVPGTTALERAHYLQQQTQAQWLALTLGPDGAWLLQRDGLAVHAREDAPITVVKPYSYFCSATWRTKAFFVTLFSIFAVS
jgi:fructokinase